MSDEDGDVSYEDPLTKFVEALAIAAARIDHEAHLRKCVRGRPKKRVLRPAGQRLKNPNRKR